MSLTLATANLGNASNDKVFADLERVMARAAVAGLQEASDRNGVLARLERTGYATYRGEGKAGQAATPLAWNPDAVTFLGGGCHLVLASQRIGPGAGPDRNKPKWLVWGRFCAHATGSVFVVGNVHVIPSVYRRRRAKAARAQVGNIADWADRQLYPTAVVGDWNMRRSHRLLKPMREAGFDAGSFVATHGSRGIDHIWTAGVRRGGQDRIETSSDHDPLFAEVTLSGEEPPVAHNYLPGNLPALLRAAGLEVVEVEGWRTRGRPASTGGFGPVGVLWHHTGAFDSMTDAKSDVEYADWLAKVGRSDLPAPLCQLSISAEGRVFVCAAGRANHAGKARSSGSVAAGDGNSLYVGVECMNSGKQGWPKSQYDAMVKVAVVLGDILSCSERAQRGHRETSTTGKWDPGMLDLDKFRADIKRAMDPDPKPTRVARAHDKSDEVLKSFRALSLQLDELDALLDKVPDGRKRVASWRAELAGVSTGLDRLRTDLRKSAEEAPEA